MVVKALIVIDMQEYYLGEKRNQKIFKYQPEVLINNVNNRINKYNAEQVFYIVHVFKNTWFNRILPVAVEGTDEARTVKGLNLVSKQLYSKSKGNSFTNKKFHAKLQELDISEIEVVGIDGGGCVALTALGALELGYKVYYNTECIGTVMEKRALKLNHKLKQKGAEFY